jgi:hypothetical protein
LVADGEDGGDGAEAHVASGDTPFIVLLSKKGAHEPDDRGSIREDSDDVGAASGLFVESFLWVVRPDLAPD